MKKIIRVFVLLVVLAFALMPMTAFAKSRNPYKDVNRRTVDAKSLNAIIFVEYYDGWRGIAKGRRLHPNRNITRRQFLVALHNMWKEKVKADILDVRNANSNISFDWGCQRMVILGKALGLDITWNGPKKKMKIKDAARYIKIFATFDARFAPHK